MFGKTIYDEENKLWCAVNRPLVLNPRINLATAILWTFSNNPEKVVQVNFCIYTNTIFNDVLTFMHLKCSDQS